MAGHILPAAFYNILLPIGEIKNFSEAFPAEADHQYDQMRLLKKSPKIWPNPIFVKINTGPKMLGYFCT
jgi:hypothetical protein